MRFASNTLAMTKSIAPGQPKRPQPNPTEPDETPLPDQDPDALPPSERPLQSPDDTPRAPNE